MVYARAPEKPGDTAIKLEWNKFKTRLAIEHSGHCWRKYRLVIVRWVTRDIRSKVVLQNARFTKAT